MISLLSFFRKYLLLILIIIATLLLCYKINKPFIGHHDWNGAFWGNTTRENLRGHFTYFPHYTPLLSFFFLISSIIFGLSEVSLRSTTVFFSIIMLIFIYKIGRTLYSKKEGLLAVALAIVTPMFLYFGKLPDHEPIITSLITITFYFYLTLNQKKNYLLFLFFLTLTLLESWSGFFLIPFFILHQLFISGKKTIRLYHLLLIAFTVIGLHLLLIYYFNGSLGLKGFFSTGLLRLNLNKTANITNFTWPQFLETETRYTIIHYTRILSGLVLFWLIRFIYQSIKKKTESSDKNLIILFLYAVFFILTFRNLAYIHDYKLYLLLPFIVISGANSLNWLINLLVNLLKVDNRKFFIGVKLFFLLTVILLVGTERLKYLQTLLDTSFNTPGYALGKLIREKVKPNEAVLVNSRQFKEFYEIFVTFYADHGVNYTDLTLDEFRTNPQEIENLRYIVLVDERTEDKNLELFLLQNYYSERYSPFTFVNVDKPLIK